VTSFKQLFDRFHEPDGIRFIGDDGIYQLIEALPESHPLFPVLVGDILFRFWLYKGHQPENLRIAAKKHLSTDLSELLEQCSSSRSFKGDIEVENPNDKVALNHFRHTMGEFIKSDGLIALAVGTGEAVPIPFSLIPLIGVRDLAGEEIPEWSRILSQEPLLGASEGVRLNLRSLRSHAGLEGSSFGLPVFIAKKKATGELPDFGALDVLATGAIVHGRLQIVDQVEAKRKLAHKMGGVFIAPGHDSGDVSLPVGSDSFYILEQTNHELEKRQIGRLSPKLALECMRQLQDDVRHNSVGLNEASRRLARIQGFIQGDSIHAVDARMRGMILQSSIANHQGHDEISLKILSSLKEAAHRDPKAYLEIRANEVVCLTDAGLLEEASIVGRDLLQWVADVMPVNPTDRKKAEMLATGVLGGQPLLILGLRNRNIADESLTLLKRAYEAAVELDDYLEICRDSVQIALWYALHSPDQMDGPHAESLAILARDPKHSATSEAYLRMHRFLGAYRRLRFHDGYIPSGFDSWDLPDESIGAYSWPFATSLKYRGALHAATGRSEEALGDFERSISLLEHTESPLLRMMAGSTAIEAAISLPEPTGCGERFKEVAEKLFYNPSFRPSAVWLEAVKESEIQSHEKATRELRRVFRY